MTITKTINKIICYIKGHKEYLWREDGKAWRMTGSTCIRCGKSTCYTAGVTK